MLSRRLKPSRKGCGFANYLVWERFNLPISTTGLNASKSTSICSDNNGIWIIAFKDPAPSYFRSTDNGETWIQLSVGNAPNSSPVNDTTLEENSAEGIATDRKGTWRVFCEDKKIYASTNDGETWSEEMNLASLITTDVKNNRLETDEKGVWFAATTDKVLRSTNDGLLWEVFDEIDADSNVKTIRSDKDTGWYVTSTSSSTKDGKIWKSIDDGDNWTETTIFPYNGSSPGTDVNYDLHRLGVSRTGTILVAGIGKDFQSPGDAQLPNTERTAFARSNDFGVTWEIIYPDAVSDKVWALKSDDYGFWVASMEIDEVTGIQSAFSYDFGETWYSGTYLFNTARWGTGSNVARSTLAYGRGRFILFNQYRNTSLNTTDPAYYDSIVRSRTFVQTSATDPIPPDVEEPECSGLIDPNKFLFERFNLGAGTQNYFSIEFGDNVWMAVYTYTTDIFYRSIDNGVSWDAADTSDLGSIGHLAGMDTNGSGKWIMNHSQPAIAVSNNDGATWVKENLPKTLVSGKVACDRKGSGISNWVIYNSTNDSYFRSEDDGVTWHEMKPATGDFNFEALTPTGDGTSWVGWGYNKLYRSDDNANTFSEVKSTTYNAGNRTKLVSNNKGTIICALNGGNVFRSTDWGHNWSQLPKGFNVYGIEYDCTLMVTDEDGLWYAVGTFVYSGSYIRLGCAMSVDDGATWYAGPAGLNIGEPGDMVSPITGAYANGRFIVGGNPSQCSKTLLG